MDAVISDAMAYNSSYAGRVRRFTLGAVLYLLIALFAFAVGLAHGNILALALSAFLIIASAIHWRVVRNTRIMMRECDPEIMRLTSDRSKKEK